MKVIIYGCGTLGRRILGELRRNTTDMEVLAFTDSVKTYHNTEILGIPVIDPKSIPELVYDKIIIATFMSYESIFDYCVHKLGVEESKIDTSYASYPGLCRDKFLNNFSQIVYQKNLKGSVAEGGVCEGYFASKINAFFPDRTFYLFDTFEGFDSRDTDLEHEREFSSLQAGHFKLEFATKESVLKKMSNPDKAIICQGYFPETAVGITDEFVFVNLDFDLYQPTLEGLCFFWEKMVSGGIILVHDFFNEGYRGIKVAVEDFCKENQLVYMPIGDELSIAIQKK